MKKPSYFGYFRSEWLKILFVILLTAIFTAGNFVETLFVSDLVDKVSSSKFANILWLATILLAVEVVSRIANFGAEKIVLKIKSSVIQKLYWNLAKALANASVESVSQRDPAEIAEKIGEGKSYVDSVYGIFQEFFSILVGVAAMVYTACCAWQVAILLAIFLTVFLFAQIRFRSKMFEQNTSARRASDNAKQLLLETISGFADVKVQNLVRGLKDSLLGTHTQEVKENVAAEKVYLNNSLFTQLIVAIYKYSFLLLSAFLLTRGSITFAQFVALFMYKGYVQQTAYSILRTTKYAAMIATSTKRMDEVLYHQTISKETFGEKDFYPTAGEVRVQNLTMELGGNIILNDLTVTLPKESFVGIVGPSGSGKSTFLKVLSKQLRQTGGRIYVDEVPVDELNERSYRWTFRLAPQLPYLFAYFTIRENLMLANPKASDEQIWDALKQCKADGFVREKGGLDTIISAKDLSGGERQRLALARTILAGGKIILLDESTSALDSESQAAIVETIIAAKKNHTIVLVAHRVSTLKDADKILFMENGKITDSGTYDELYSSNERFRYMAEQG